MQKHGYYAVWAPAVASVSCRKSTSSSVCGFNSCAYAGCDPDELANKLNSEDKWGKCSFDDDCNPGNQPLVDASCETAMCAVNQYVRKSGNSYTCTACV